MNKYSVFTFEKLKNKLIIQNFKKTLKNWIFDEKEYKYLFLFGGDGTFISKTQEFIDKKINICLLNLGKSSFLGEEINSKFISLIEKKKINFQNFLYFNVSSGEKKYNVLNDIFLCGDSFLECEIYINNKFFNLYRGFGILISTQKGSSAFNKSLNSTIILPSVEAGIFNFIFPQQNKTFYTFKNSFLFSEKDEIKIKVISKKFNLYFDNQKHNVNDFNIVFKKSVAKIVHLNNDEYIEKLKNYFLI